MHLKRLIISILAVASSGVVVASAPASLERAVELYSDGRWIDARLELLDLQRDNLTIANTEELEFYLAMCAVELDDTQAEVYLSKFEKDYPSSKYLNRVRFSRALLCCSEERYDEAKELFSVVDAGALHRIDREKFDMRMGYILFREKSYNEALLYLENIPSESDIYQHALYYRSYIAYYQGDNVVAREGFTSLLKSEAYAAVAPYYLVQIEFNDGNYESVLSEGVELYARSTPMRQKELSRSMAEAAFRLERYDETIGYIDDYINKGGYMGRAENYLKGFSLYREVRYFDATSYLRAACGADDALTQNASYHLADCYLKLRDKSMAINSFAMAANDEYNEQIAEDALFNYAKLQYELGGDRFNGTINTLTRYINKYPSSQRFEEAKTLLIAAYYNSRDYDAAYRSIKELKSPDSDIRLSLQRITLYRGLESYNVGNYDTAVASLEESLSINISPKYSSIARFWMGEIAFARGEYNDALRYYNSYLVSAPKGDPTYNMALYNIGYSKLMLLNDDEALGYFQRFVSSTNDDNYYVADANNRIGDLFYGKRQFAPAAKSYSKVIATEHQPKYYALYQSAIIDGINGKYDAKIARLNSIIKEGRGNYIEDAMYELGRSYIVEGDYKEGVEAQERFIARYPSSDKYAQSLSYLGLAYLNLGERSNALKYYDRAIKAAPQSAVAKDALQGIREIYINDGDADGYFKYAASVGHKGDLSSMTRDSLTFTSAQKLYLSGDGRSKAAVESLNNYINNYPQGYYTTDALFYLSDCYLKQERSGEAIATLTQLSKQGANQYSERVYDRLSSLAYNEGEYLISSDAYKNLYLKSEKTDVKSRALQGYADATTKIGKDAATLKMVDYVSRQSGVEPQLLVQVKHTKAKILYAQGDVDEAMLLFKELSEDPHSAEGAESRYRLIAEAFKTGDMDSSESMIFEFAESDTEQSYWLAKSFIVLGDIYCFRKDYFQARATYQSILDGYTESNDNIVEQAKAKIDKLP